MDFPICVCTFYITNTYEIHSISSVYVCVVLSPLMPTSVFVYGERGSHTDYVAGSVGGCAGRVSESI